MLESYVEDKIISWAKNNGWLVRKMKWIGRDGAPDRFFLKRGRIVIMEIKRPDEVPNTQQQREIDRLAKNGAEAHWVDNIADGIAILKRPFHGDIV